MSLYNEICGENPRADAILALIGLTREQIPRYRDCYINDKQQLVMLTRTGGSNRDLYRDDNDWMRRQGYRFIETADDPRDPTFAHWCYMPAPRDTTKVAAILPSKARMIRSAFSFRS